MVSDEQLMRRVRDGDAVAFAGLYDRHATRSLTVARGLIRDRGRAQDVVQEAFLEAWRQAATYRPERGTVQGWLLAIVRHRAIDALRREHRMPPLLPDEPYRAEREAPERIDEQAASRARATAVRAAVRELPDRQRRALTLAYYAGLTHSEIAASLGVPLGTAKGAIRGGLERLRWPLRELSPET